MIYDAKFINNLPDETIYALGKICNRFLATYDIDPQSEVDQSHMTAAFDDYEEAVKALGFLIAFADARNLHFEFPKLSGDRAENVSKILEMFHRIYKDYENQFPNFVLEKSKQKYEIEFGRTFIYEFPEDDLKRIQELINELRTLISESKEIEENHKARLLSRLEKLQSELHKKVSDLDRFWGLIGDAGLVMGKLGKDAKPIVDRIRELVDIVWKVQTMAEGLPSNTPIALPPSEGEDNSGG